MCETRIIVESIAFEQFIVESIVIVNTRPITCAQDIVVSVIGRQSCIFADIINGIWWLQQMPQLVS